MAWIKKQQADFEALPRQSIREMVSGESHYLWGKQHRLDIVKTSGKHKVSIKGHSIILGLLDTRLDKVSLTTKNIPHQS
ncbi:YgjP-like metallopeptidase domain-containing protein [Shewanella frigidimarina]|uniref:YgjP-like metallopeptidase domain-containing protein n=1 Tax=Shewanella frigidimarina TaxID=56812 RepID=UPI003D7B6EA2